MASIAVSGLAIEKHFKKIYEDLEGFRKWKQQKEGEEASDALVETVVVKVVEVLEGKEKYAHKTQVTAVREEMMEKINDVKTRATENLQKAEVRLEERIVALEAMYKADMEENVSKLEKKIMMLNDKTSDHDDELANLNAALEKLNKDLEEGLDATMQKIKESGDEILEETRGRISDTFCLVDDRLVQLETNLNKETLRTTEAFDASSHRLGAAEERIQSIVSDYALSETVSLKADITEVLKKAEREEVLACVDSVQEMSRRMDMLGSKMTDDVKRVATEGDSKMENKVQYVIALLRKEREVGGTDIGKTKCLVCDQAIPTREDDPKVQLGKLGNNTMALRRGGRNQGSPPRERPGSPGVQVKDDEQYYHKTLASMSAMPVNDALNSVIQKYAQEQQAVTTQMIEANDEYKREFDEGIQRARIEGGLYVEETGEFKVPTQVSYPPPPTNKTNKFWTNRPNPGDSRYATHTGSGSGAAKDYFKSLEMKFGSTGSSGRRNYGSGSGSGSGSGDAQQQRRPGTATSGGNSGGGSKTNPLLAKTGGAMRPMSAKK
jgi:hypothetical protein